MQVDVDAATSSLLSEKIKTFLTAPVARAAMLSLGFLSRAIY